MKDAMLALAAMFGCLATAAVAIFLVTLAELLLDVINQRRTQNATPRTQNTEHRTPD